MHFMFSQDWFFWRLIYRNARRTVYSPEKPGRWRAGVVYWHFIDVVWMFFYPALYFDWKLILKAFIALVERDL